MLCLLAWLCYRDLRFLIPLQVLLIPWFLEAEKWLGKRRRKQYLDGFREMLRSLTTSMQAGFSLENACKRAGLELRDYYGQESHPILSCLDAICRGIDLNIRVEELFFDFARETEMEDIYEFTAVVEIARDTGGNMVDILKNTSDHLQARMEAEEEIRVCLSGIQFEKNIMLLMPMIMLVYLNITGSTYTEPLYSTIPGRFVMSLLLIILLLTYYWTENIMKGCSLLK